MALQKKEVLMMETDKAKTKIKETKTFCLSK
jgi:hypothetical protein